MRVFCDFDGTITVLDTTDQVLTHRADPHWQALEEAWIAGRISAAECMRGQIALIDTDEDALDAVLDRCQLREGFVAFAGWCRRAGISLTIVSDGVDRFIRRILSRHGLEGLPVVSNRLTLEGEAYRLDQPHAVPGCAAGSGVCKCAVVRELTDKRPVVFIGDGRSDFCVSQRADILFARDRLATYAAERNRTFIPFETFDDIRIALVGDGTRNLMA
ncbi:MtnX-like HAD-IB family phosphatase [Asticcacaulis sp.]|jgi:2,3-diketo-5-methylthio-1-phosphopentane phosphatase|uniref:MtnX-like HAD-IB family phosphatase n=1 Tax=Asticcacaulis sp. TaxID=1872648 RepID=UPI00391C6BEF